MRRLNFLVEGQTEETFVRDVLQAHFLSMGTLVNQGLTLHGPTQERKHKGGVHRRGYGLIRRDVLRWLNDSDAWLTTMFDFYGLPEDFPGVDETRDWQDPIARVERIEHRFFENIESARLIPYIQLHEFEALLFSDTRVLTDYFSLGHGSQANSLIAARTAVESPEHINNSIQTAPSKRICAVVNEYRKRLHGPILAQRIGLDCLRANCPHFREWMSRLESLGE